MQLHLLDAATPSPIRRSLLGPLDAAADSRVAGSGDAPERDTCGRDPLSMNLASANPSGAVAYVDLAARKVIGTTYPIPSPPSTVVASNTTAYVLDPGTGNEPATIYSARPQVRRDIGRPVRAALGWPGGGPAHGAGSPDGRNALMSVLPHLSTRADTLTSFARRGCSS